MKTKRRQELKTNDLAQAIEEMGKSLKDWGIYLVGALAVVGIAWVISTYRSGARADFTSQGYIDLDAATRAALDPEAGTDADIEQAFATIGELKSQVDSVSFKLDALVRQANMALALAESGEGGIDATYLSKARAAYQEIIDNYSDRDLYRGRALFGLFQVEANEFAVDGDPQHRDQAVKYLERLRDDSQFTGMPFQTVAVDLLNDLDSVFTSVTFPKAPATAMPPAAIPPTALPPTALPPTALPPTVPTPATEGTPAPPAETSGATATESPLPETTEPEGAETPDPDSGDGHEPGEPEPEPEPETESTPPS
jgi:hypothetical protein